MKAFIGGALFIGGLMAAMNNSELWQINFVGVASVGLGALILKRAFN